MTEQLGHASATDEFLDRWRVPGETASRQWEDRFGEEAYLPLARSAFDRALDDAGVTAGDIDHLIVTGTAGAGRGRARRSRSGCPPTGWLPTTPA